MKDYVKRTLTVKKILILYIIFIFCILFSFLFFSFRQVKLNEESIDVTNKGNLSSVNTQLAYSLDSVRTATVNAGMRSDISTYQYFKSQNQNEISKLLNQKATIRSNLKNIVTANQYISSMDVMWFAGDTITTRNDLEGLDLLIGNLKDEQDSGWHYINHKDIYYVSYFPNFKRNDAELAVSTKIRKENVYRLLFNAENEYKMKTFVIFDKKNTVYLDTAPRAIMTEVQSRVKKDRNDFDFICHDGKTPYKVYMKRNPIMDGWLVSYINYETIKNSNIPVIRLFIGFVTILMGIAIFIFLLFYTKVFKNLGVLIRSLKKAEKGDYTSQISIENDKDFEYVFTQFNSMVNKTSELITNLTNERDLRTKAEFRHLQAQIEPHFFYNNLFFIMSMARKNPDAVESMASHLAEYYRYKTNKSLAGNVTLGQEIDLAKHYLSIMSLRKKIKFTIDFPDEYENFIFLPLIIQPLVENAVCHGIEARQGANKINLTVVGKDNGIEIILSDDGQELTDADVKKIEDRSLHRETMAEGSIGLWNVQQRLANQYGEESRLKFRKNKKCGLIVRFWIPLNRLR